MKRAMTAVGMILSSCTAMQSVPINSPTDSSQGQTYYLPTTRILLVASINSEEGNLTLQASQPEYIADQHAGYALNAAWSPFNSDTYDIKTDARGLLSSIDMKSAGKLDESLVNLAKSAAAVLEANIVNAGGTIVFSQYIDMAKLADDPKALALLNAELAAALKSPGMKSAAALPELAPVLVTESPIIVRVWRETAPPTGASVLTGEAKCTEGICYRRLVPYILTAVFADGRQQSSLIEVPNGSPTYSAAIRRGAFTDWNTTATLTNGVLTGYKGENGSEAAELLLLPFEMVGGALAGITQQGQLFTAQSTAIKNQTELEKSRQAWAKERGQLEANIVDKATPLFTFTVGRPKAVIQKGDFGSSGDLGGGKSSPPGNRKLPSRPGEGG